MKQVTEIARFTDRIDEMAAFYEGLLGCPPAARSEGMAIFVVGETRLFLHAVYQPKEGELPPEDHLAFTVADVDAECSRLVSAGLKIEIEPREFYWGTSAYLRDPDGGMIELIQAAED